MPARQLMLDSKPRFGADLRSLQVPSARIAVLPSFNVLLLLNMSIVIYSWFINVTFENLGKIL